MKITLDLTPSVQSHAGLGRYTHELACALLATCPPDEQLLAFYNDPLHRQPAPLLNQLPTKQLALSNKLWRLKVLLAYLARQPQNQVVGTCDIFYAGDHLLPYLRGPRTLFLLADVTYLSHPHTHSPLNRTFLQLMAPHFLRAADAIITISQCTLSQALTHYDFIKHKVYIIYSAVNAEFRPVSDLIQQAQLRARYSLPERFLLYVGTIEPRKNLSMLFEAFKQANIKGLKLVIAGKKGWLYREIFARLQTLGLEQDVLFTGFVPDDDLPTLYSCAEGFVFPSLYEGFGLPVLEAMACGTPVISSNTSSLPEVTGDAAQLVAPDDVRGWAEAITRLAQDAALRAELRERGLRRASRFTWQAAARQTRELYRELYAHRP
jgi:glycosyltransferase involved in cell wall biosynthesis